MKSIPALIVGTGFGSRVHLPALRKAGFDVVGLVGTDAARLERKASDKGVPAFFTDLGEAIDQTGAKAVTIATPPESHARLAMTAIKRGCHVICEKPFASDAAEAQALLEAAESQGLVHFVAHEFRWQTERLIFGRAIADGLIGEPRFLVVDGFLPLCADPAARLPGWWLDKQSGGGWLGANGSHVIDQIRAWLGDFESLSARLFTVSDRADSAEDSFSLRFRMQSGVEGSIQESAGAWGAPVQICRCAGTKGSVWIEAGKVMLADKDGQRELQAPEPQQATGAADPRQPFELPAFEKLAQAFHDRISGIARESAVSPATFHDGVACMVVMDAIRRSSAHGGRLETL